MSRDGKLSSTGEMNLLQAAVLLAEVGDFIRPETPAHLIQKVGFPILAALGRALGYRARYEQYSEEAGEPAP